MVWLERFLQKGDLNKHMLRYLTCLLLLAACTNNHSTPDADAADTAAHVGGDMHRNTHMDNVVPQDASAAAPLQSLHTAMQTMMDSMHTYRPTGNADHDFAALMRLHHKSAVEMAQAQLTGGKDSSLRSLAQNIITGQQHEMNLFSTFLQANPEASGNSTYGKNAMNMMSHMGGMQGGSVDHMFASMMIPHHQDGVKMAEAYLKEGKDAVLLDAARNIMRTQPQEVKQLEQWLAQHRQ